MSSLKSFSVLLALTLVAVVIPDTAFLSVADYVGRLASDVLTLIVWASH